MQKGLELCDKVHPDLLLGTDPDCDRCGTAVPDGKGGYRLITGNEMGIILLDYICRTRLAQRHDARRSRGGNDHCLHRYGNAGGKKIRRRAAPHPDRL